MSEGLSERERLARALWLEFYDWTSSWEATDQAQWLTSADALIAAGFGYVAQITAERDAALAIITEAIAQTKRGNLMTPPWVIAALNGV